MPEIEITEDMIFQCFAAAEQCEQRAKTAESFIDVEEYEGKVMYPEFARWAEQAGFPALATLFRKVAGEESLHAVWLRDLYREIGVPARGEDTQRAVDALQTIQQRCDELLALNPTSVIEKALRVALAVEEREYGKIYPRFRDQAEAEQDALATRVYQKVIDSERQHAEWFRAALQDFPLTAAAVPA